MQVRVEFYGVPRLRAGCAESVVSLPDGASLGDLLVRLSQQFPAFAEECLEVSADAVRLAAAYTCNLDGERFVRDADAPLAEAQSVIILAADAGG